MTFRDRIMDFLFLCVNALAPAQSGQYPLIHGVPASKTQIELALAMGVKEKYVNYPLGGYYVDIALPRKRIAIEYNGKFWHQHKSKEDMRRVKALNRCGWRVLSILSDKQPPAALVWEWVKELEQSNSRYLNKEY